MSRLTLRYGESEVSINIPSENLLQIVEPNELPGVKDEVAEITRALTNPINSKRISELGHGGQKVAIIVSDITRPTPSHKLLPPLLRELNDCGIPDGDITIVFATGLHRRLIESEMGQQVGLDVYHRVKCINHDVDDCTHIGTTGRGTKVNVLRAVVNADVVVCVGTIELHYFAGYSGGAKSILPGVSSKETIEMNHRLMFLPGASSGKVDSPVRADIEEAGAMLGIDFILNVVLNAKKEIVKAFAGHMIDAHRAGVAYVDEMYKVPVKDKADIVITSSGGAPKDLNMYQAYKALDNATHAITEGGSIILVAECAEGLGNDVFERWVGEAKSPGDVIRRIEQKFVLGGHMAAQIAKIAEKHDIYLVSAMTEELTKKAFFTPVKDAQDALARAMEKHGKDARVIVMPYGNSTLPVA